MSRFSSMTTRAKTAVAVAALTSVAGIGVAGATIASADDATPSATTSQSADQQPGGNAGKGKHHGDGGQFAAELASKLGVDQQKVKDALAKARPAKGQKPDKTDPNARKTQMAAALAKELGIDQAKVTAALDAVEADHRAKHIEQITPKLDAAVKAGTITEADKASIIKGLKAGVIGGMGAGPHAKG